MGNHILRAKTNWAADVPDDPCIETVYGETEDYSVIIVESSLGIIENSFTDLPIIYPNPTDGNIFIDLQNSYKNVTIQLFDILGRNIMSKFFNQGKIFNFNIDQPTGVYFLSIVSDNKEVVFRLLKK